MNDEMHGMIENIDWYEICDEDWIDTGDTVKEQIDISKKI